MSLDTYHPIHHIWFYLVAVSIMEALAIYILAISENPRREAAGLLSAV